MQASKVAQLYTSKVEDDVPNTMLLLELRTMDMATLTAPPVMEALEGLNWQFMLVMTPPLLTVEPEPTAKPPLYLHSYW
jgi:hypothetical protein